MRLIYARSAWEHMMELTHAAGDDETGGILAGMQRGELILVLFAGGPGECDRGSRSEYELLDVEHHEAELASFQAGEPSATWIGTWHRHPSGYRRPSEVDLHQGRSDLEFYNPPLGVLMPITFCDDGEPTAMSFWLSHGSRDFVVMAHEILDLDAGLPWVRTAAGRSWAHLLRRNLEAKGFRTRLTAGSSSDEVGIEASHTRRSFHLLFLIRDSPACGAVPSVLELAAPDAAPGDFICHLESVDFFAPRPRTVELVPWPKTSKRALDSLEVH